MGKTKVLRQQLTLRLFTLILKLYKDMKLLKQESLEKDPPPTYDREAFTEIYN